MRSANFVVCNWAISHISGHTPCVYCSTQLGQKSFEVTLDTLCETGRRYQSQYRFINPFESDPNNFPKSISIIILRPHRRPFEEIDIENEAFAL